MTNTAYHDKYQNRKLPLNIPHCIVQKQAASELKMFILKVLLFKISSNLMITSDLPASMCGQFPPT